MFSWIQAHTRTHGIFLCKSFHRLMFTVSFVIQQKIEPITKNTAQYFFYSQSESEIKRKRLWVFHFGYWPRVFISIVWISALFNCTVIHIFRSLISACVHIWWSNAPFFGSYCGQHWFQLNYFFHGIFIRLYKWAYAQSNIVTIYSYNIWTQNLILIYASVLIWKYDIFGSKIYGKWRQRSCQSTPFRLMNQQE